ncbi:hypothetical protein UFOVP978_31 [uncultured Caudovirales phage]|uniref:Phage major tail protein TP901-1 n=1 Tax=uncultured Caudovirales phage TaxID=2100421 RepID=A0A6J5PWZ8_9CAUD|nr:hypothetical protein UFOVP978_31 [uncultured Caudovirales phage]
MPSFRHGKNTYFGIGSAATLTTIVDISTYLMQVQMPRPVDVAETSTFGTSAKTYVVGMTGSAISFSGRFDDTLDTQLSALLGVGPVTFNYGPGGNTATYVKYSGQCFITSYDVSGGVGDMVGFSVQAQITGAVTKSTF